MTKWKIIIPLMLLALLGFMGFSSAVPYYDMCDSLKRITKNCTMVTPTLSCVSYDYNLTNVSSGALVVEQGYLELLNGSQYYFNLTQPKGEYAGALCDGTTFNIVIKGDEEMYLVSGLLLLSTMLILFGVAIALPKKHMILKALLFVVTFYLIVRFAGFGWIYVNEMEASESIKNIFRTVYHVVMALIIISTGYGFIRFLGYVGGEMRKAIDRKHNKENYPEEWEQFW